jgi:antitoxin component YwqK of YwqJK toxin-antitoxin module
MDYRKALMKDLDPPISGYATVGEYIVAFCPGYKNNIAGLLKSVSKEKEINREHIQFRCKSAEVIYIKHHATGAEISEIEYDGILYRKGEIAVSANYYDADDCPSGEGIYFYKSLKAAKEFYPPLNGTYHQYNLVGRITATANFRDGEKHGLVTIYFGDTKCEESMYQNGLLDGKSIYYDVWENIPIKTAECHYHKGKLHGPYYRYDRNGDVGIECQYQNGEIIQKTVFRDGIETKIPIPKKIGVLVMIENHIGNDYIKYRSVDYTDGPEIDPKIYNILNSYYDSCNAFSLREIKTLVPEQVLCEDSEENVYVTDSVESVPKHISEPETKPGYFNMWAMFQHIYEFHEIVRENTIYKLPDDLMKIYQQWKDKLFDSSGNKLTIKMVIDKNNKYRLLLPNGLYVSSVGNGYVIESSKQREQSYEYGSYDCLEFENKYVYNSVDDLDTYLETI